MMKLIQLITIIVGSAVSGAILLLAPLLQSAGEIDWATIARYVPEIMLVVIFMGYTYLRDEAARKERMERAAMNAAERKERADADAIERREREAAFLAALTEERNARTQWGTAFATGLQQLSTLIQTTNNLITTHDTWERAVVQTGERRKPLAGD